MAKQILQNARLFYGGYDLSGSANALSITYGADVQESTVLVDTFRSRLGGLKDVQFSHAGYWDDAEDATLHSAVGGSEVVTVLPATGAEGEVGYIIDAVNTEYNREASIGEVFAFTLSGAARATGLIRGTVLINAQGITASGTGTGYNLGSVASGQSLYAALHVLSISGSGATLDVLVESDVDNTFSSPATQITFTQATAQEAQLQSAPGPITDSWFRVNYTVGGTSPSVDFAVVVGIK